MLGWEVFVNRPSDANEEELVASWNTGALGLKWLSKLVEAGRAKDLGGNGYPGKYAIEAGVLLPIIRSGLPGNDSPPVIGDDYALPRGWSSDISWKPEAASACKPGDVLIIEVWDQS